MEGKRSTSGERKRREEEILLIKDVRPPTRKIQERGMAENGAEH